MGEAELSGKLVATLSMLKSVVSKNGAVIRLTEERWQHISEEHCELLELQTEIMEAIRDPLRVLAGNAGELLAVRELELGSTW